MNGVKTFLITFIIVISILFSVGCSGGADPNSVQKIATSTRAYGENTADKAIDGDLSTGWVSAGIASEINSPYFQLEFDEMVSVSSITINDDFLNGRTTEVQNFETVIPSVKSAAFKYTSIPNENRTAIGVFSENSENGWECEAVPSEDAPQAFYGEFRSPIQVDRLVVDNYENSIVPISFSVYVSKEAVSDEYKLNAEYEGWQKVASFEENDQIKVYQEFSQTLNVRSVLYVVKKQSSESLGACLRGLYFQQKLDKPDQAHYPVDFNILYSKDGLVYEIIEIKGNDKPVYTYVFEKSVELKFLRYLPITEYGGNKPSIGEIIVE